MQKLTRSFKGRLSFTFLLSLGAFTACGIKFKKYEPKAQFTPVVDSETADHQDDESVEVNQAQQGVRPELDGQVYDFSQRGELWEYDSGPDVNTAAGKAFAQIIAETPNYRALGSAAFNTRADKFKWKMGPMFYRGRTGANQVKVLVIGQEGAQDENSSFRSFTGGTGGRMQHFLRQMGIDESYIFINTFSYTINGQYGEREPILKNGRFQWTSILSPQMLKLSQNPESPIVKNRNKLIDHIVRVNPESLRLVIAVGGAAKESLASYVMARGGTCENMYNDMRGFNRIKTASEGAGGNRRFYYPVDATGKSILLRADEMSDRGRPLAFTWGKFVGDVIKFENEEHQAELQRRLTLAKIEDDTDLSDIQKQEYRTFQAQALAKVVKLPGGLADSGFEDPRQLGIDFNSCKMAGEKQNLKGAEVPAYANTPGAELPFKLERTVHYVTVQHPGSNSPALQSNFKGRLVEVKNWLNQDRSWSLEPDTRAGAPLSQPLDVGYRYTHLPVPRRDFRFGLPELIGLGDTSTTRKSNGSDANSGLVIGGRESGARFDEIQDVPFSDADYKSEVSWEPSKKDFADFDFGPGAEWTRIFTGTNEGSAPFPIKELARANTSVEALYGFGAIFRGRPANAKLVIVADEAGYDDIWVGRALVGEAGQRLQSLIEKLNVGKDYVIFRSVPVSTAAGSEELKQGVFDLTREWRKSVLSQVIGRNADQLKAVVAIGRYSSEVLEKELDLATLAPTAAVKKIANADSSTLETIYPELASVFGVEGDYVARLRPIPRADIPYGLPRWVGTAGDRVANATQDNKKGKYFMVAAPRWSTKKAAPELSAEEKQSLRTLGLLSE